MKIVKKTLKGNLLGKTGFKKVPNGPRGATRTDATPAATEPVEAPKPTRLKPRTQASLDALVKDDDVVVINETLRPQPGRAIPVNKGGGQDETQTVHRDASGHEMRGPKPRSATLHDPHVASTTSEADADVEAAFALSGTSSGASKRMEDRSTVTLARTVLLDGVFRRFGRPGSRIDGHAGASFELQAVAGHVRSPHSLLVPLPDGHVLPHDADLVIELDNGALLVLDIASSGDNLSTMKARAFDAAHLLRLPNCFNVQLFIRSESGGMAQELAESLGHDYDHHHGIDEGDVSSESKYAGLQARIGSWLEAARAGPGTK